MQRRQRFAGLFTGLDPGGFYRAQPKHATRNLIIQTEAAEIFTAHDWWPLHDVTSSQGSFESTGQAFSQFRIVVGRGSHLSIAHLDDWRAIVGYSGGGRDILCNALDRRKDPLTYFFPIGTDAKLQLNFVGDDVGLGAAVNRTDSDDGWVERRVFATDNGLQGQNSLGRNHDWIFCRLGFRSMTAKSANGDFDRSRVGECKAWAVSDLARLEIGIVVQRDHKVRFGNQRIESAGQHGFRAIDSLLRRLSDQNQGTAPLIFQS